MVHAIGNAVLHCPMQMMAPVCALYVQSIPAGSEHLISWNAVAIVPGNANSIVWQERLLGVSMCIPQELNTPAGQLPGCYAAALAGGRFTGRFPLPALADVYSSFVSYLHNPQEGYKPTLSRAGSLLVSPCHAAHVTETVACCCCYCGNVGPQLSTQSMAQTMR